jgi:hypothetical protein
MVKKIYKKKQSEKQKEQTKRLHALPRSAKQLEAFFKSQQIGRKLPRTKKQIQHWQELLKKPRTKTQREASRASVKKACEASRKLPRTKAQLEANRKNGCKLVFNPHGSTVSANDIIEHHNDLCHGAERPDDVTLMTHSEHSRLHMELRIKNGTHPHRGIVEPKPQDLHGNLEGE